MLQKVRELSAEAFFGEDSVEKSGSRGDIEHSIADGADSQCHAVAGRDSSEKTPCVESIRFI